MLINAWLRWITPLGLSAMRHDDEAGTRHDERHDKTFDDDVPFAYPATLSDGLLPCRLLRKAGSPPRLRLSELRADPKAVPCCLPASPPLEQGEVREPRIGCDRHQQNSGDQTRPGGIVEYLTISS
jgi:hypothetical protein